MVLTLTPNYGSTGTTVHLTGSGFTPMNATQCLPALQLPLYVSSAGCIVQDSGVLDPSSSFVLASGNDLGAYPVSLSGAQAIFVVVPATTITATSVVLTTETGSTTTTVTHTSVILTTTTSSTTATISTTLVSAPFITAHPAFALAGSSEMVTITGANFVGTTCALYPGLTGSGPPSCSISSGTLSGSFTVNPSAAANLYTLVVQTNAGEQASCPFVILPSITQTLTNYNTTVTRTSTSTVTSMTTSTILVPVTTTSTVATVPGTSTVYTATTTDGYYTSYLYTWTYPGYTTVTIPTATVTVQGVSVQTIYTGVTTETHQYTVTVSQQNVATVGGGTTTLWSTQTLPTTVMQTVINGTTSIRVTESNFVEPPVSVVTQTVYPPSSTTEPPQPAPWPLWLIIAIILTAVGGTAVGLFFILRRGGVLARLRPKPELEEEPEPVPVPRLDTDMKPEAGTETVAQPAPAQVSPSGKVMCGGCGGENLATATSCELCGLSLASRTTAESEDAMAKVGTGEGGGWHT